MKSAAKVGGTERVALDTGFRRYDGKQRTTPSPLPSGERALPPRSCASVALRKSHGGKGEGETLFPVTPSPRAKRRVCSPQGESGET